MHSAVAVDPSAIGEYISAIAECEHLAIAECFETNGTAYGRHSVARLAKCHQRI